MSSGSSADPLTAYLAGQVTAEQLVVAVTAEYYRDARSGMRDTLRPVIEVIERAHPGVVELAGSQQSPGFAVRLANRPFPKRYEDELRTAVTAALETHPASRIPHPEHVSTKRGLFNRIFAAIRKVFSA